MIKEMSLLLNGDYEKLVGHITLIDEIEELLSEGQMFVLSPIVRRVYEEDGIKDKLISLVIMSTPAIEVKYD